MASFVATTYWPVDGHDAGVLAPPRKWAALKVKFNAHTGMGDDTTRLTSTAAALTASTLLSALAGAKNDKMVPMPTPPQPTAITLTTGTLPSATAPESWHNQYGSAFARNVVVATLAVQIAGG